MVMIMAMVVMLTVIMIMMFIKLLMMIVVFNWTQKTANYVITGNLPSSLSGLQNEIKTTK